MAGVLCIIDLFIWLVNMASLHSVYGPSLQVMLFCEYPFERPEDANSRHRTDIVLERVVNVQYKIPEGNYSSRLYI